MPWVAETAIALLRPSAHSKIPELWTPEYQRLRPVSIPAAYPSVLAMRVAHRKASRNLPGSVLTIATNHIARPVLPVPILFQSRFFGLNLAKRLVRGET